MNNTFENTTIMNLFHIRRHSSSLSCLIVSLAFLVVSSSLSFGWWDKAWEGRKVFTIDTSAEGGALKGEVGDAVVLVRLHAGNLNFGAVKEDGSDLRFVGEDDKTELPFQIEKYDSLLNEAYAWVRVAGVKAGGQTKFYLYYGNAEGAAGGGKTPFDGETVLVYHFGEKGAPGDSSEYKNAAENAGVASEGSMIAGGLRLLGGEPVKVPASDTLGWKAGGALTWSAWVKAGTLGSNAVLFSREEGGNAFRVGMDQGVPYVEIADASGEKRTSGGAAVAAGTWKHLAAVVDGGRTTLYVDGEEYGAMDAGLPALGGPLQIGGDFVGEIDELEIARVARPVGYVQMAAVGQSGSERAGKLLAAGEDEGGEHGGGGKVMEHLMLFGDIAHNMMFDGWVVIFCCIIMACVGWTVAVKKLLYINRIQKGTERFLEQWSHLATDLTAIDPNDPESVSSLGGKAAGAKMQKLLKQSPLYHIYAIGAEEIRHRLQRSKGGFQGLSGRSIQAIRASLDAGLTRETHRLNGGLVFLTISIAGGPYVGLLGTVVGVMVTFAVIAKSGEVEVNSIAPGIASALLATVAGLLVAIPALFIYSYLNSRIRDAIGEMQMFIDEFVTKMAEFYPTPAEGGGVPVQRVMVVKGGQEGESTGE